jgi:imidazolonepropionase-like amidohydrolase
MRRWEDYATPFQNPVKLQAAGVLFAIATNGSLSSAPNERNLPYEAAKAVAHGLPHDEALKAVTLYPAQILGVADRLGSLESGKDATFIVTDGDPLEIATHVERAFILGREIDLTNRQTALYEKYREKLRQQSQ